MQILPYREWPIHNVSANFLDNFGQWDPTLTFVMAGALVVMSDAWMLQKCLPHPLLNNRLELPKRTANDRPLVNGAALFGIGWAIAGLCTGPALVGLVLQPVSALIFLAAMYAGRMLRCILIQS